MSFTRKLTWKLEITLYLKTLINKFLIIIFLLFYIEKQTILAYFTTHYFLPMTHDSLPTTHDFLPTTHDPLSTTHDSLPTTHDFLPRTYGPTVLTPFSCGTWDFRLINACHFDRSLASVVSFLLQAHIALTLRKRRWLTNLPLFTSQLCFSLLALPMLNRGSIPWVLTWLRIFSASPFLNTISRALVT